MELSVNYSQTENDRRHYERVPVALFGRCMLPNNIEIPCQATNISAGDVGIIAANSPQIGDTVIMYLDHVGRVEGPCVRLFDGGFALTIDCTPRKREKLAARIEWLKAHKEFSLEDERRYERVIPRDINNELRLSDGRSYPIKIIDISLAGAAVEIDVKPAVGTSVSLAGMPGKVVRHFAEGIGLDFETSPNHSALASRFGSPKTEN